MTVPPSSNSPRPFEPKRAAELRRRNEAALQREMDTMRLPSAPGPQCWQGQRSSDEFESDMSEGLSSGMVQELQGEVVALRDVLSVVAVGVGLRRPPISELDVLPAYEEAR